MDEVDIYLELSDEVAISLQFHTHEDEDLEFPTHEDEALEFPTHEDDHLQFLPVGGLRLFLLDSTFRLFQSLAWLYLQISHPSN